MIKTVYTTSNFGFFCFAIFFFRVFSDGPPATVALSGQCQLNFNEFPYQPTGDCMGHQEKIKYLGSIDTTLCCRYVLDVLTKNLAEHANKTIGNNIFMPQEQWESCNRNVLQEKDVSAHSCGFDKLYNGSHACTSFSLSSIQQDLVFQNALNLCSSFGSSFNDACSNCTQAILDVRNNMLSHLKADIDDGAGASSCIIAVVIAIVASRIDDRSSIDDFYRCLSNLRVFDPGYIKLRSSAVKMVLAIIIASIVLMLVLLLIQYVAKSKKKKRFPKPATRSKESTSWSSLYRFSIAEIENAISYGNDKISLGQGSAGEVYKGVLPSGQVVAVKHIYQHNSSDSFQREVAGLSRVRHPNLVCLFGCCIEGGERYLVYEYCSAGNLAHHLLRKDSVLTWDTRVNILRGCALGLRYLHHYVDGCIVHRDVKLTNILLTDNMEAKLSDFGLARMLGLEESKVFTDVRGTIGYMDPEYMSNSKLTCASDVYSFGIVILQLLSGQKVIDLDLDAREQLTRKAKDVSCGKRPLSDIEDPRLEGRLNRADFEAILQIAVLCVAKSSKGRPTIDVVYEEIEMAWANTVADMRGRHGLGSSSPTSLSRSLELQRESIGLIQIG
ncbi:hypothetical protein K2173_017561 [Erythroxylum novogranatense]|uniref:Protein kinase domain-containing protein n=1 Tax=Erythroxylum novogranatense TaxID=1862640 RepID=A0AAV8T7I5_9ROSI|nr:hypothetical protein K2173_017561 [Erythroxylum novogranatense]